MRHEQSELQQNWFNLITKQNRDSNDDIYGKYKYITKAYSVCKEDWEREKEREMTEMK